MKVYQPQSLASSPHSKHSVLNYLHSAWVAFSGIYCSVFNQSVSIITALLTIQYICCQFSTSSLQLVRITKSRSVPSNCDNLFHMHMYARARSYLGRATDVMQMESCIWACITQAAAQLLIIADWSLWYTHYCSAYLLDIIYYIKRTDLSYTVGLLNLDTFGTKLSVLIIELSSSQFFIKILHILQITALYYTCVFRLPSEQSKKTDQLDDPLRIIQSDSINIRILFMTHLMLHIFLIFFILSITYSCTEALALYIYTTP